MLTRRSLLIGVAAALSAPSLAQALDIQDYDAARVQAAMASGQPVVVHVYAPWCLQCHMQKSILDGLKAADEYKTLVVFRVDYDNQKDIVAMFDCPRATVIAYKGGKEVKRMSWGMTQVSVEEVLKAAL
jgi:thioredoxin-like negative regulator of GroEL